MGSRPAPFIPLPAGLSDPRTTAATVFDGVAPLYDRARPRYPARALEDLFRITGMGPSRRILEIGCGTGQLTRDLAKTGAQVRCIERGPALAALARENLADLGTVEVEVGRFEDAPEVPGRYDLVVSATAFHWVDPDVGYEKAARLLAPGGHLGLLTNAHGSAGNHNDEAFADGVRALQERLAPEIGPWTYPDAGEIHAQATAGGDIAAVWARVDRRLSDPPDVSAWFDPPFVATHSWIATFDRAGYLDLLATQSSYALMEADRRAALFEGIGQLVEEHLGGRVTKEYVTILAIARVR